MTCLTDARLWWLMVCALGVVTACMIGVVRGVPGVRRRVLFGRKPVWFCRFVRGELSVWATVWQGGPVCAFAVWWVSAMGYAPPAVWLGYGGMVWCGVWAVAAMNAARKSQLRGIRCVGISLMIGLLWVVGAWGGGVMWFCRPLG